MRLQLDSALTGANQTKSSEIGQAAPAGGSGSEGRRVGPGGSNTLDSIQISGASSALNRLSADRTARIEQLTSAVQSGSYQVSSSQVGGAIVEYATSQH